MSTHTPGPWQRVSFELQGWRIPDHVRIAFESNHDVGAFRVAGREAGCTEEALDWLINEAEKEWRL